MQNTSSNAEIRVINDDNEVFDAKERQKFMTLFDCKVTEALTPKQILMRRQKRWTAKIRNTHERQLNPEQRKIKTMRCQRKQMHTPNQRKQTIANIQTQTQAINNVREQCINLMRKKSQEITRKLKNRKSFYVRDRQYQSIPTKSQKSIDQLQKFSIKVCGKNLKKQQILKGPKQYSMRKVYSTKKNTIEYYSLNNSRLQCSFHKNTEVSLKNQTAFKTLVPNLTSTLLRGIKKEKNQSNKKRKEHCSVFVRQKDEKIISMKKQDIGLRLGYTTKKISYCKGHPYQRKKVESDEFSIPRQFLESNMQIQNK